MSIAELIDCAMSIARRRILVLILAWAALVTSDTAMLVVQEQNLVLPPLALVVIAVFRLTVMYLCIRFLLSDIAVKPDGSIGKIFAFFGLVLIASLAEGIGYLLLILPGLYLTSRWIPAVPILLSDRYIGIMDALKTSWNQTQGHVSTLSLSLILSFVPMVAGIVVTILSTVERIDLVYKGVITYGFMSISLLMVWIFSVATFELLRADDEIEDVFG